MNMRVKVFVFITIFFIFGLCASVFAIHETVPAETQMSLPGADAAALYKYIIKSNPYAKWKLWPEKGKLYKGTGPHGPLLTTYVNETAFRSARGKTAMSDGAIIVKENYTAEAKLIALTVLYKIKGYDPAKGDWFWARYTPEGKAEASGKVEACINCHEKRKDNDYIFSGPLN